LRNDALPYPYTGDDLMNKLILATLATAFAANVAIPRSVAEANGILNDLRGYRGVAVRGRILAELQFAMDRRAFSDTSHLSSVPGQAICALA
jgi:hypothetical protein